MRYPTVLSGIAFALLAATVLWWTRAFPPGSAQDVGPAFFPRVLAIVMLVMSGLLVYLGASGKELVTVAKVPKAVLGHWALTLGAFVISVLLWRYGRYEVGTFLFIFTLVWFFERSAWWRVAVFAGATTAFFWLLFAVFLQVSLRVVG